MGREVTLFHLFLAYITGDRDSQHWQDVHRFAMEFPTLSVDIDGAQLVAASIQELRHYHELSPHLREKMQSTKIGYLP